MSSNTQGSYRPYVDKDTFHTGNPVVFKPGVGLINTDTGQPLSAQVLSSVSKINNARVGRGLIGIHAAGNDAVVVEKNYVLDLELAEYLDTNNLWELLKNLVWSFAQNYVKVAMAQPLEMVRLVLQVGKLPNAPAHDITGLTLFNVLDEEEESHIDYFQLTNEWNDTPHASKAASKRPSPLPKPVASHEKLQPRSLSTWDILSLIANLEGPLALFKGVNASFIYNTLSHTIEAWITGLLSPFLGVPDPYFLELTHSNDPARLLWLLVLACVVAGLVLMPLDLIRIKFMITKFSRPLKRAELAYPNINTRSLRELLRYYPRDLFWHPPASICVLTSLYQVAKLIFRKTAPYLLFIRFNIDSYSSPNVYTFVNLFSLIAEFFVTLPVENLLRKEQVRFLVTPRTTDEDPMRVVTIDDPDDELIVNFNDSWFTDDTNTPLAERVARLGLFNGWQVGLLKVMGFWGLAILKDASVDIREERL